MIKYYKTNEVEQGTPLWHSLREGLLTGTNAYDIILNKSYEHIITSKKNNNFTGNYYTRRGHTLENEARELYSEVYNKIVEYGFITNSEHPKCGYSPDGIIENENGEKLGLWECKAFNKERHLKVYKSLDSHVLAQIQFGLYLTGLPWCDLTLYNPDMDDINDTFLVRRITPIPQTFQKFDAYLKNLEKSS